MLCCIKENEILKNIQKSNNLSEKLLSILDKIINIANNITEYRSKSYLLSVVVSRIFEDILESAEENNELNIELLDKAVEIVNKIIEEDDRKEEKLYEIASTYIKIGYNFENIECLNKALEIANDISIEKYRYYILYKIVTIENKDFISKILNIIDKILKLTYEIKDIDYRSIILYYIANIYIQTDNKEEALKLLNEVSKIVEDNCKLLCRVVERYIDINSFDKAIKLLDRILNIVDTFEDKYKLEVLYNITKCYIKMNNLDKAAEILNKAIEIHDKIDYDDVKYMAEITESRENVIKEIVQKIVKSDLKDREIQKGFELISKLYEHISKLRDSDSITPPESLPLSLNEIRVDSLRELEDVIREFEKVLESKPKLDVEIVERTLKTGWNGLKLKLVNEGYAHAYDVLVTLSGDVEVKPFRLRLLEGLKSTTIEIPVKPKEAGEIPVDITVEYKDAEGKDYKDVRSPVWVQVISDSTPTPVTPVLATSPANTLPEFPSQLLSKYEPLELLGEGGFSLVFKCKRKKDGKLVAVKIPKEEGAEETGKSFIEEIANWKKLKHINVVELFDYNVLPYPYMEIELCDSTLKELSLTFKDKMRIACRIADALSYAHSKGIVHGDLKPSNVLIKRVGSEIIPKLTDWGLGFTPAYSPPEVVLGEQEPDEQADVWSFGVVLYELSTGTNPFQGEDEIETIDRIVELEPDLSSLGFLKPIVAKCLEKDRNKRYKSMIEVRRDLANLNLSTLSNQFSRSKSKLEKVQTSVEIINTYLSIGDFDKAKKRVDSLVKYNFLPHLFHEVYKTIIDLLLMDSIPLSTLELKYKYIIQLIPEKYRAEFENDEYIGRLINAIFVHFKGENIVFRKNDDEYHKIKNVFCIRLLDKLGEIAMKSV